jgi:hypothetical protein
MDAYRDVDDEKHISIEHVYFDRLREAGVGEFPVCPEVVGQSASTGKVYRPYDEDVIQAAAVLASESVAAPPVLNA